jgi:L-glutamine-phosphate cytidylyltransferase
MKLLILAAGVGSRLFPLTKNTPKSLLELGDGTTLLERQIENAIVTPEIDEVMIITGYKSEQIEAKILCYKNDIKISTLYNPFYDISNNLMSLWCAHYVMMDNDFMITNGDNIYKNTVYLDILKNLHGDHGIQLTVDFKESYDTDDMKVQLKKDQSLMRVHKNIELENTDAESVGLAIVKGEKERKVFVEKLISMSKNKESLNKFWLEIFNALVNDGISIKTVKIDKNDWREMDFHPDMESIKKEITNNLFSGKDDDKKN